MHTCSGLIINIIPKKLREFGKSDVRKLIMHYQMAIMEKYGKDIRMHMQALAISFRYSRLSFTFTASKFNFCFLHIAFGNQQEPSLQIKATSSEIFDAIVAAFLNSLPSATASAFRSRIGSFGSSSKPMDLSKLGCSLYFLPLASACCSSPQAQPDHP